MKNKIWILLVTVISGVLGGGITQYLFTANSVFAHTFVQHQKIVKTEELILVDENGSTVAWLGQLLNGKPALGLYAKESKAWAGFGISEEGLPVLDFYDKKGENRARLELKDDGSPSLNFLDAHGQVIP